MSEYLSMSLFGYNRRQVDDRLAKQRDEIAELKAQLQTLQEEFDGVSKDLADYQEMEDALKSGIIDARVAGEKIIAESNREADRVADRTNQAVAQYKEEFAYQSRELMEGGSMLKEELNTMKETMLETLSQYQEMIESTDFDSYYPQKEMDRFYQQMDAYEDEAVEAFKQQTEIERTWSQQTMSDEEKSQLQQLIQEVVGHEEETPDHPKVEDGRHANLKLINKSS